MAKEKKNKSPLIDKAPTVNQLAKKTKDFYEGINIGHMTMVNRQIKTTIVQLRSFKTTPENDQLKVDLEKLLEFDKPDPSIDRIEFVQSVENRLINYIENEKDIKLILKNRKELSRLMKRIFSKEMWYLEMKKELPKMIFV